MHDDVIADGFVDQLTQRILVSELELARVQAFCLAGGKRLASTLSRLGLVSENDIAACFAAATGFPMIDRQRLSSAQVPPDINCQFLVRHSLIPLYAEGDKLAIAMADPEDDVALRGVMFATGAREIEPMVATFGDVEEALARLSGTDAILQDSSAFADIAPDDEAERLTETESDAPVIRLVHRLLANAVNRRASDVHIEPMARHLAVRYRIDGRLTEVERLPHALAGPIASRIKIMSALDIAECRLPQDGRLRLTVKGRDVDVRVSTSPIAHGESLVLRLLGRTEVPLDLDQLGLSPTSLKRLKSALERPHGMILLTGPTGSGKTTTLYAAINRLRRPEVKILTVEDPVEVLLDGINQVQVRPDIDLGYPATLRAFLRQDPDILMIGEIRDRETADIAMRAALTGHLVLSTLHTNSAIGAFTRLRDIGIEPFLTASTIIATLAQRLVRGLCTHCAQSRPLSSEERRLFTSCDIVQPPHLFEPSGCEQCGGTGFSGRVPLIDYFEVNEAARTAIRDGSISDWENRQRGAESLLGHGLSLVAIGRTALSEVRRVVDAG